MADEEQLALLRSGVDRWNAWRQSHPDVQPDLRHANLGSAFLMGANLREAKLIGADLEGAMLAGANLRGADLMGARLSEAELRSADLQGARLWLADLSSAKLIKAKLIGADLSWANLRVANLSWADLTGADLTEVSLIQTCFFRAILDDCRVYGVAAWDVRLDGASQTNLHITPPYELEITVDDLEIAQFLYLMIHNEKLRQVIDTLTSKVVLILGRFTPERKAVLDALRVALRHHEPAYVPVLFDFERSDNQNFTETVTLLARMARFIIADLTEPASIPQELEAIVPHVHVPVRPIIAQDAKPYAMFRDFRDFPWMLKTYRYADLDSLTAAIGDEIIAPAEAKVKELRAHRQAEDTDER